MLIKICGITTCEAAQAAREAGADLIGFVFAPSKRRIEVAAAVRIGAAVPGIGRAGVFVNAPLAQVRSIAAQCKLDYVQLHGEESPAYCAAVGRPVIKALRAEAGLCPENAAAYPAAYVLLDSSAGPGFGGTGIPFDWRGIKPVREKLTLPVLAAGGLHSGNVAEAIRILRPDGVDVSGGVETGGNKDAEKIARFVRAVRQEEG